MESPTKNPLDIVRGREQEIGPLLSIVVILVLLLVGAFYFSRYELEIKSKNKTNATSTEIIIYRNNATSTQITSTTTENAELDAIQNKLEIQMQNIDGLNF